MRRAALILILLVGGIHAWQRRFLIDDAFISYRYAAHLVSGYGLVFNPGERVEGYTNFLWTLLMAGGIGVGLDPETLSQVLGVGASLALLWVLWRWGSDLGMSGWWALAAPAMLAVNRSYALWATGGLETRLFSLLVVAGAWRLHREAAAPDAASLRPPASSLLLALACLTRPEGYLAAAVALAVMAGRRRPRWLAAGAITLAAVCGAHILWRLSYYGDWVPNSFHAKVAGLRLVSGVVYLGVFAWQHLVAPAVVVGMVLLARRRRPRVLPDAFALLFTVSFLAYVLLVGGDHFEFRFVDPVLPLLYLMAAMAMCRVLGDAAILARGVSASLLVAAAAMPSVIGFHSVDQHIDLWGRTHYVSIASAEEEATWLSYWRRIGVWLRDHADASESIAVTPAGVIPYITDMRTLDMLGINDREIARMPALPGRNVGHEKRVEADVARARGITYLVADPVISLEPIDRPERAVEVDFGDFYWYFMPLVDGARIRPGSTWQAASLPDDPSSSGMLLPRATTP